MTAVIIALVSFAVAFAAGFILSKAYFTVHGTGDAAASARRQLKEQRQHYRKQSNDDRYPIRCLVDRLTALVSRHDLT